MEAKIAQLWPEIAMFITTCVVMVVGLSKDRSIRRLCAPICGLGLLAAAYLAVSIPLNGYESTMPFMATYGKVVVAGVGLLLLMLMAGLADRGLEAAVDRGAEFEPLRSTRAEFYSFFMFSLTGVMLCCGATDLIFLFLALELTSLPTYVLVALSTGKNRSMEAGVKYFFLGALGAAMFLYGFALIYGATGTTNLAQIAAAFDAQALAAKGDAGGGTINTLGMVGLVVALVGVMFKIAAVPMHFYTPDVYQGAATPVTAMLAFVPKTAGFFAILLLVGTVGWRYGGHGFGSGTSLPESLRVLLWTIAVLTMTTGNVLALMQSSAKRMLAYSSIAHSGYMLVGVVAGPGDAPTGATGSLGENGLAAVLFYLLAYGVMTVGSFGVLASLERRNGDGSVDEVDHLNELRGLWKSQPALAAVMVVSAFGLLGLPPLAGFLGKLPLFTSALNAGEVWLVVILGVNSAIAACYYLRLVAVPFLEKAEPVSSGVVQRSPYPSRLWAGVAAAVLVVLIGLGGGFAGEEAAKAGRPALRAKQGPELPTRIGGKQAQTPTEAR
jgi:NADH-quinone oxidoreductase subunit N